MSDLQTGSPEFDLLCLTVRPNADLERIRHLLRRGIDHSRLLQLAEHHGVRPSLLQCLGALSWDGVPLEARRSLEAFRHRHLKSALMLLHELARVATLYADSGIPLVTFKGPALALTLYGDLAGREYNDIDIIVPEDRIDEAERLLERLTYRNAQGDRAFRRAFLASQRQYAFARADGNASIDLHWNFCGAHAPFPLRPTEIWENPSHIAVGEAKVATVGGANLALLLAGHGMKEGWAVLKWAGDFARLIVREPDLNWLDVYRRARRHHSGDSVLLGCAVARDLLGTPVPQALDDLIAQSDRVRRLTIDATRRVRAWPAARQQEMYFTDLDLCDGRWARFAAGARLMLTPTAGDHEALPLPQVLWPAYYLTRPFRLAAKAFTAGGGAAH